ncbi:MAG: hypothetical protein HY537_01575 [Deltaproteobacteria bacterium]|nr:hypothetical protein [Deltaproteobacteria bacterium]
MQAKQLHEKAVSFSKSYLQSEKELLSVLIEMQSKKYYLVLGYTGVFNYCMKALGFCESQAAYFSSVVKKTKEVPELKKAIDAGILSVSKARRIVSVITPTTSSHWIEKAAVLPQKELEKEVAAVNPKAVGERIKPVALNRFELRIGIEGELQKKWQRAMDLVSRKQRKNSSMEQTLQYLVEFFLEREDPVQKAQRSADKIPGQSPAQVTSLSRHMTGPNGYDSACPT